MSKLTPAATSDVTFITFVWQKEEDRSESTPSFVIEEHGVVEETNNRSNGQALSPYKAVVSKAPIQLKLLLGSITTAAAPFGLAKVLGQLPPLTQHIGLFGSQFPIWSLAAFYGTAATFIIYFAYDCFVRRDNPSRDSADCLDKCVYVVRGERRVFAELFELSTSVVKSARRELCITGSRSRDAAYLMAIEGHVASTPELSHVRVLIGPSRNDELDEHIERLKKLADSFDRTFGNGRIKVAELPIDRENAEKFIVASETRAVIALPSFTSPRAYDAALIIEDDRTSQQLCAIIRSMAESSQKKIIWRQGAKKNEVA